MKKLSIYCPAEQGAENSWTVMVHTVGTVFPTDGDPLPYDSDLFALIYGRTENEARNNAENVVACFNTLKAGAT